MVDTAYEPTRAICDKLLAGLGIETTYYDPLVGADISALIKANTKVIFLESPGSLSFEMQDIPAITDVAKQHNIVTILDNTWASPILCQPFALGVDVSVQSATKYIVGHSDVMLGTASANEKHWPQLREHSYLMGYCASADDAYTALRGLRTLSVRLKQHEQSALKVANWLAQRPEVETVLHPALPTHPGHSIFQRDFSGSNGLFSFVAEVVRLPGLPMKSEFLRILLINAVQRLGPLLALLCRHAVIDPSTAQGRGGEGGGHHDDGRAEHDPDDVEGLHGGRLLPASSPARSPRALDGAVHPDWERVQTTYEMLAVDRAQTVLRYWNWSLSSALTRYQELQVDVEFAEKQLAATRASLQEARAEARRKQAYLEKIAAPSLPDYPEEPRRIRSIFAALVLGLLAWGVLAMLAIGVREHRD